MGGASVVEKHLVWFCRPSPFHSAMPPPLTCGAESYNAAATKIPTVKGRESPRLAFAAHGRSFPRLKRLQGQSPAGSLVAANPPLPATMEGVSAFRLRQG